MASSSFVCVVTLPLLRVLPMVDGANARSLSSLIQPPLAVVEAALTIAGALAARSAREVMKKTDDVAHERLTCLLERMYLRRLQLCVHSHLCVEIRMNVRNWMR